MIAFEVEVDGKKIVSAGVEDWSILALHVDAHRKKSDSKSSEDRIEFHVGGLTLPNSEKVRHHFRWPAETLTVGSMVTVRITETELVNAPAKRYRADEAIQENPFTEEELRQLRYKNYLELKAEFEPSSTQGLSPRG